MNTFITKHRNIIGALALVGLLFIALPLNALAQIDLPDVEGKKPPTAENVDIKGTSEKVLENVADILVIIAIGLVIIMVVWGAIVYMTAGGNEERAASARAILFNGIIGGIILVLLSFIIGFIFDIENFLIRS